MQILITAFLKRAMSEMSLAAVKELKTIPEDIEAAINFLEEEPLENYSYKEIKPFKYLLPLTINRKSIEKLRSKKLYDLGKTKEYFNMIYIVGQFLTRIANILDLYSFEQNRKELDSLIHSLTAVWGSHKNMSAQALADAYYKKQPSFITADLLRRLKSSLSIFNDKILPFFKKLHPGLF